MKVGIVTGGNRGIGYEIVRGLLLSGEFTDIYLTSRNETDGIEAVKTLTEETKVENVLKFFQLDLTDLSSMQKFINHLDKNHKGGYDVLVQNAAIAFKTRSLV